MSDHLASRRLACLACGATNDGLSPLGEDLRMRRDGPHCTNARTCFDRQTAKPVEPPPTASSVEQRSAAPKLCPDPILGSRDGWAWCSSCGGIQPPGHTHGEPDTRPAMFKTFTPEQIDSCMRVGRAEVEANEEYARNRYPPDKGGPALKRLNEVRAEHAKLFRDVVLERAEFAESLLCAMAFDHWHEINPAFSHGDIYSLHPSDGPGCAMCDEFRVSLRSGR